MPKLGTKSFASLTNVEKGVCVFCIVIDSTGLQSAVGAVYCHILVLAGFGFI